MRSMAEVIRFLVLVEAHDKDLVLTYVEAETLDDACRLVQMATWAKRTLGALELDTEVDTMLTFSELAGGYPFKANPHFEHVHMRINTRPRNTANSIQVLADE